MTAKVTTVKHYVRVVGCQKNETRKKDMIYCEFEDQSEQMFWKKVERIGSEQRAGIGNTILVEATSKYKSCVGKQCVYAINYTKDAFIMILNCDY